MNFNSTISYLSLQIITKKSPFFQYSHLSLHNTLVFSKIGVRKSHNSFFSANSPFFSAKFRHSTFNKFLKTAVRVVGDKYSLLDTKTRVVLTRKSNVFMNDCSFIECSASGIGTDGNGGAICIFLRPEDQFSINLERINFNKCTAKSSGGSIFAFNTKFVSNILCVSECHSTKNTIFYLQNSKSITLNFSYYANNDKVDKISPSINSIGCSCSIITINEVNMSNTRTNYGSGFISAYRFKYLNMNHAIYDSAVCDYGLYVHSLGELTTLSHACIFKNSTFNQKMLMDVDVAVTFYHCVFSLGDQNLVIDPQKPHLTLSSCYIEGSEDVWKEKLKGVKFSDMHYTDDASSVTKFTLVDAKGSCRSYDSNLHEQTIIEPQRERSQNKGILRILVKFSPAIIGFVLGYALVYCLSKGRKKSSKHHQPAPMNNNPFVCL